MKSINALYQQLGETVADILEHPDWSVEVSRLLTGLMSELETTVVNLNPKNKRTFDEAIHARIAFPNNLALLTPRTGDDHHSQAESAEFARNTPEDQQAFRELADAFATIIKYRYLIPAKYYNHISDVIDDWLISDTNFLSVPELIRHCAPVLMSYANAEYSESEFNAPASVPTLGELTTAPH